MSAPRAFHLALRRVGTSTPGLTRFSPAGRALQARLVATETITQSTAHEILAKQRVNRPVSPHLTIYRPQITWYTSLFHRVTGGVLSSGFYLFGLAYLVAPLTGWHLETPSLVEFFHGLSEPVKVGIKAFMAAPFVYHALNGVRHLSWDVCKGINNRTVMKTGWTVVALTAVGTVYLAFLG